MRLIPMSDVSKIAGLLARLNCDSGNHRYALAKLMHERAPFLEEQEANAIRDIIVCLASRKAIQPAAAEVAK